MLIKGNFDGYIGQIPFRDTPGRPVNQLLFLPYGPKHPIFGPKIGPKWPKMAFLPLFDHFWLVVGPKYIIYHGKSTK